jgi:hypothetical protein
MENPQSTTKLQWIIVLTLSLTAGVLGFYSSYQDEQTRFSEISSVAASHLIYALQLKDDMALIDWSKRLEKLPSILTFQVDSGSRVIATGGNQQMCPAVSSDGLSFDLPYHWIVHSTLNKDPGTPMNFTVVFQDFHGPLLWAICLFGVSFVPGVILIRLKALPKANLPVPYSVVPAIQPTVVTKPSVLEIDNKSSTLVLDADYMICQATPLAAKALDRPITDLVGSHFFDLSPDPSVIKVIAEAKETEFLKPFPSHPHLSALIHPIPEGTLLVLKTNNESERP